MKKNLLLILVILPLMQMMGQGNVLYIDGHEIIIRNTWNYYRYVNYTTASDHYTWRVSEPDYLYMNRELNIFPKEKYTHGMYLSATKRGTYWVAIDANLVWNNVSQSMGVKVVDPVLTVPEPSTGFLEGELYTFNVKFQLEDYSNTLEMLEAFIDFPACKIQWLSTDNFELVSGQGTPQAKFKAKKTGEGIVTVLLSHAGNKTYLQSEKLLVEQNPYPMGFDLQLSNFKTEFLDASKVRYKMTFDAKVIDKKTGSDAEIGLWFVSNDARYSYYNNYVRPNGMASGRIDSYMLNFMSSSSYENVYFTTPAYNYNKLTIISDNTSYIPVNLRERYLRILAQVVYPKGNKAYEFLIHYQYNPNDPFPKVVSAIGLKSESDAMASSFSLDNNLNMETQTINKGLEQDIKIYAYPSGNVVHKENKTINFNINNTNLSKGIYFIESTDSEGNKAREKVYKTK